MIGLAYLAAFAVYLIISLIVVLVVATRAKTWKWRIISGVLATLFMYNLVFWDYLPTKWAHQYYCQKEAGFWVYKTAEQWRKENPDVVVGPVKPPEGMVLDKKGNGDMTTSDGTKLRYQSKYMWPSGKGFNEASLEFNKPDGSSGYWLNNRFFSIRSKWRTSLVDVSINSAQIVDAINNEIMMKDIHIYATPKNTIKFWNYIGACGPKDTVLKNSNYDKL